MVLIVLLQKLSDTVKEINPVRTELVRIDGQISSARRKVPYESKNSD